MQERRQTSASSLAIYAISAALSLRLMDSSSNPASLRRLQIASSARGVCKTLEPGVKDKPLPELKLTMALSDCGLAISESKQQQKQTLNTQFAAQPPPILEDETNFRYLFSIPLRNRNHDRVTSTESLLLFLLSQSSLAQSKIHTLQSKESQREIGRSKKMKATTPFYC